MALCAVDRYCYGVGEEGVPEGRPPTGVWEPHCNTRCGVTFPPLAGGIWKKPGVWRRGTQALKQTPGPKRAFPFKSLLCWPQTKLLMTSQLVCGFLSLKQFPLITLQVGQKTTKNTFICFGRALVTRGKVANIAESPSLLQPHLHTSAFYVHSTLRP